MQTCCIFVASNCVIRPQIVILSMFKIGSFFLHMIAIKFSMSLFFYMFTFAINLWHRKFVTADIIAVLVNNQNGIQRQGQDFDKNTEIYSAYTVIRVEKFKSVHLKCNLFAFFPYLLNICRKFEFLISQGSVATCLR